MILGFVLFNMHELKVPILFAKETHRFFLKDFPKTSLSWYVKHKPTSSYDENAPALKYEKQNPGLQCDEHSNVKHVEHSNIAQWWTQ